MKFASFLCGFLLCLLKWKQGALRPLMFERARSLHWWAGMYWGPAEGSSTLFCLNSMLLLLLSRFSHVRLCGPHRRQPTRLPRPWNSPGKNTGVSCHFLLQCKKVKGEREVAQSCPTLSNPMDCSLPGSSIHGIFRQEYWSGLPLPSPNPGN